MKTKMFMMAMMMTIATSAMAANHPKNQCDRNHRQECTCNHDCRVRHDNQRKDIDRCPTCGKQTNTKAWPDKQPQKPQGKQQPKKSFGSQQSRVFGSRR